MEKTVWNNFSLQDSGIYSPQEVFQAGIKNHDIANTAYPIHHTTTINEYRVEEYSDVVSLLKKTRSKYNTL